MKQQRTHVMVAALLALAGVGCDDPVVVGDTPTPGQVPQQQVPVPAPEPTEIADAGPPDAGFSFDDEAFVELEAENRDPFRNFATVFRTTEAPQVQYRVTMPNTSIDEMRLIAIVTGTTSPRAMLIDQTGVGYAVRVGEYLGRPEVIQTGGADSMPVTLNWRVARIRRNQVVLSRRDPTDPDRPPLTRIIPLYEEGEDLALVQAATMERERERQTDGVGESLRGASEASGGGRSSAIPQRYPTTM